MALHRFSVEAVFFQFRQQHLVADLQHLRGASLVAPRLGKHRLNLVLLGLARGATDRLGECPRQIEVARQDRVTFREDDGPFDAVLKLADVDRPTVRLELLERLG